MTYDTISDVVTMQPGAAGPSVVNAPAARSTSSTGGSPVQDSNARAARSTNATRSTN